MSLEDKFKLFGLDNNLTSDLSLNVLQLKNGQEGQKRQIQLQDNLANIIFQKLMEFCNELTNNKLSIHNSGDNFLSFVACNQKSNNTNNFIQNGCTDKSQAPLIDGLNRINVPGDKTVKKVGVFWTGFPHSQLMAALTAKKFTKKDSDNYYRSLETWICMSLFETILGGWNGCVDFVKKYLIDKLNLDEKTANDIANNVTTMITDLYSQEFAKQNYDAVLFFGRLPFDKSIDKKTFSQYELPNIEHVINHVNNVINNPSISDRNIPLTIILYYINCDNCPIVYSIYFKDGKVMINKVDNIQNFEVMANPVQDIEMIRNFFQKIAIQGDAIKQIKLLDELANGNQRRDKNQTRDKNGGLKVKYYKKDKNNKKTLLTRKNKNKKSKKSKKSKKK